MLLQSPPDWCTSRPIATGALRALLDLDADERVGNKDEFALVAEDRWLRGWYVRGWSTWLGEVAEHIELSIALVGERQSYLVDAQREARADVAAALLDDAQTVCGYVSSFRADQLLDGVYELGVHLKRGARQSVALSGTVLEVRRGEVHAPSLADRPVLHVLHVPKTGGTTFRNALEHAFGDDIGYSYASSTLIPPGARCIQGHSTATTFAAIFPQRRLAIWFREPVERAVSEYHHNRRTQEETTNCSLEEFVYRPGESNKHSLVLDGVSLDQIDFIGITEQYERSVELFARMFGVRPAALSPENVNPAKCLGARYELSPTDRRSVIDANQKDLVLYEQARRRFERLCRTYRVS